MDIQKTPKVGILSVILTSLFTVAAIGGGYYYFTQVSQDTDTPPSLQNTESKYKGSIQEKKTGFIEYTQEDIDNYKTIEAGISKTSQKNTFKATAGTIYGFADEDTTLGEIVGKLIIPTKKTAVLAGAWDPESTPPIFKVTAHTISNWKNSTVIASETQIKAGHGFFILTNRANLDLYKFKAGDAKPETKIDLNTLTQGWNLIALNPETRAETLKAYSNSVKSVWVLKDSVNFEKVKDFTNKEGFSSEQKKYSLTWLNFKTTPVKNVDFGDNEAKGIDPMNQVTPVQVNDEQIGAENAVLKFQINEPKFKDIKVEYEEKVTKITLKAKIEKDEATGDLVSDNPDVKIKKNKDDIYELEIKNLKNNNNYDVKISLGLEDEKGKDKESVESVISIKTEKKLQLPPKITNEQGQNVIKLTITPKEDANINEIAAYKITYENIEINESSDFWIDFIKPAQTSKKENLTITQDNDAKTATLELIIGDGKYEISAKTIDTSGIESENETLTGEMTPPTKVKLSINEDDDGNTDGFLTNGENTFFTLTLNPEKAATLDTICVTGEAVFANITVKLTGLEISETEEQDPSCLKKFTNIGKEISQGDNKIEITGTVLPGVKTAQLGMSLPTFKNANAYDPAMLPLLGGIFTSPEIKDIPVDEEQ